MGNALFIATSLAVIVASASVGIAVGPLLGGTLGEISWRGPFYRVEYGNTIGARDAGRPASRSFSRRRASPRLAGFPPPGC